MRCAIWDLIFRAGTSRSSLGSGLRVFVVCSFKLSPNTPNTKPPQQKQAKQKNSLAKAVGVTV